MIAHGSSGSGYYPRSVETPEYLFQIFGDDGVGSGDSMEYGFDIDDVNRTPFFANSLFGKIDATDFSISIVHTRVGGGAAEIVTQNQATAQTSIVSFEGNDNITAIFMFEDEALNMNLAADDGDLDDLVYSVVSAPGGALAGTDFSWQPVLNTIEHTGTSGAKTFSQTNGQIVTQFVFAVDDEEGANQNPVPNNAVVQLTIPVIVHDKDQNPTAPTSISLTAEPNANPIDPRDLADPLPNPGAGEAYTDYVFTCSASGSNDSDGINY